MDDQQLVPRETLRGGQDMPGKTRIVIADDHPFIRIGIRNIIRNTPDLIVVGEANNGYEALELVHTARPDVLLLDMEMPGMRGIEVAQRLSERGCRIPILALSAHDDRQYILGMFENGAAGYLLKEEVPETIVTAIRSITQGKRGWVSARVAARIGVWMSSDFKNSVNLDPHETQILRLFLLGKENQEIGVALGITEGMVKKSLEKAIMAVRASLGQT
jgi:DNA-binding NarL/FixJ family response regulator